MREITVDLLRSTSSRVHFIGNNVVTGRCLMLTAPLHQLIGAVINSLVHTIGLRGIQLLCLCRVSTDSRVVPGIELRGTSLKARVSQEYSMVRHLICRPRDLPDVFSLK